MALCLCDFAGFHHHAAKYVTKMGIDPAGDTFNPKGTIFETQAEHLRHGCHVGSPPLRLRGDPQPTLAAT